MSLVVKAIAPDASSAIPKLIPENSIHAAFLRREDVAKLAPEQQAEEWAKHKEGLGHFLQALRGVPLFVIDDEA